MLVNLKLVLRQHRKFLAIFFFVVFLPSIILAVLGIRAIQNERYKLRHQNQQLQMEFVDTFQNEVLFLIERNSSSLKELAASRAFVESDYPTFHDLISLRSDERLLLGHSVLWNHHGSLWIPDLQDFPSAGKSWEVPSEWSKLQPQLKNAEVAEFRRQNYSEAISNYTGILSRALDSQVRAWILGRIARCQVKGQQFKPALSSYLSILADSSILHTESGRPLVPIISLQVLDILRLDNNMEAFYQKSQEIYQNLTQNVWSLDGDQVELYAKMLQDQIDRVAPEGTAPSYTKERKSLEAKLDIWHMALTIQEDVLPGLLDSPNTTTSSSTEVYRESFEQNGKEFLILILPVEKNTNDSSANFIGSLIPNHEIVDALDPRVSEKRPPGAAILLRSTLSGKIIYGSDIEAEAAGVRPGDKTPVLTDFFLENFPPWRVEVYETDDAAAGFYLYKNIFFWTILALLLILLFGSGLIIRTIVQEVNLLNLKSDFIASVSHEFKTPLTAMGAILERLLDDEVQDPQKAREYYRILSHDSERLKRLVKNVLDFTKIEEGKRKYRISPLDIEELVRREAESFENENKLAGFTVNIEIPDVIPPVLADREAISQALHNILDNAAKFSTHEKRIDMEVLRRSDYVEIFVSDKGIGIPENEQKKIFEKFYRGKQASIVSPTGTGLGLTLVKHIMKGHGGEIKIQSQPGKGSCVSLVFPIQEGK